MSTKTRLFSEEALRAHGRLSQTARAFLEYVEDHPELLVRTDLGKAENLTAFVEERLQQWPTFVSSAMVRQMEEACIGIDRLVKSVFQRLFRGDWQKMARILDLDPDLVQMHMTEPTGIEYAISRSDWLLTPEGLKCIEINMGSHLGRWSTDRFSAIALKHPLVKAFLEERGETPQVPPTTSMVLAHLTETALARGFYKDKVLNIGICIPDPDSKRVGEHDPDLYQREFKQILASKAPAMSGQCLCGTVDELEARGYELHIRGHYIGALYEAQDKDITNAAYRCAKSGKLALFTGPLTPILSDKRTFAFFSDPRYQRFFNAEERAFIQRHIPWTRQVKDINVLWRGREVTMPDLLRREQSSLVLKASRSLGGQDVIIGRETDEQGWNESIENALCRGDWMVQEILDTDPIYYQYGAEGCEPHHLVFGVYNVGNKFAGALVRMLPRSGSGVVNISRGAFQNMLLEVSQ